MRFTPTLVLVVFFASCSSRPTGNEAKVAKDYQANPPSWSGTKPPPYYNQHDNSGKVVTSSDRTPANYIQTKDGWEYIIPDKRAFTPDTTISPCENFYEHACSTEIKNFTLRPDRSIHVFSFSDAQERIFKKKKEFFANIDNEKFTTEYGSTLRSVYKACMDESAAKRDEAETINTLFGQLSRPINHAELLETLYALNDRGLGSIFGFSVDVNLDEPTKLDVIPITGATYFGEREYYEDKEVLNDYTALVTTFFKSLRLPNAEARARRMVDFETRLGLTMLPAEEQRKRETENAPLTVDQFLSRYHTLQMGHMTKSWPASIKVRDQVREMLEFLNREWHKTNIETLRDLALFHTISGFMDDAHPTYIQAKIDFRHKHLGGPEKRSPRNERCASYVSNNFSREIDAELLPKLFPNFPKERFLKLSERIRSTIVTGLKANTWLTPQARQMAIKKISTAKLMLIEPKRKEDWGFNPSAIYSASRHTFNKLSLNRAKAMQTQKELRKPRNRDEWLMAPLTINAYYMPADNTFVMPIGILQPPFFDADRTDEENIGTIGSVMGHELGHGIDDQGSQFDAQGKLVQWMGDDDINEFKRRSTSLIDQFNKAGHKGEFTLGENIADLVGVTFAYEAAFPGGKGSIELKKKFFYAYAQNWCFTARQSMIDMRLKEDTHALGWARVNEQVKHQPGFAEAFSCKAGDPMTLPEDRRVRIW